MSRDNSKADEAQPRRAREPMDVLQETPQTARGEAVEPCVGLQPLVMQPWHLSYRADSAAVEVADRHYSRQKPGTKQFVPPGSCLVLRTHDYGAIWTTSWPKAEWVKHEWAGAWMCSLFRNESGEHQSSDLIRAAVAATLAHYGEPPPLGMVTFVNPRYVPGFKRRTPEGTVMEWGYSYQQAGFEYCGWTQGGLFALQLLPDAMPPPLPACGVQQSLFLAA